MYGEDVFRIKLVEDASGDRIDASWLGEEVIEKLLNISDPRNNPNEYVRNGYS